MTTSLIKEFLPYLASAGSNCHPSPLVRLSGGGNNQTYRFEQGSEAYFVKRYFSHPSDSRDRQGNEFRFISFLRRHEVLQVPEIVECDSNNKVTVFKFIAGSKLLPHDISNKHVEMLAQFFLAINKNRAAEEAYSLQVASESFFTLLEHLHCVSNRVDRLSSIGGSSDSSRQASDLIKREVLPLWNDIKNQINTKSVALQAYWLEFEKNSLSRCLSPSDFGFHNALLTDADSFVFVDFEYSGWDDPAKTICDLYWQVACSLTPEQCRHFYDLTKSKFEPTEMLANRIRILLPVLGIKWCCIVLNHFAPQDSLRKVFSRDDAESERVLSGQLQKAQAILSRLQTNDPLRLS